MNGTQDHSLLAIAIEHAEERFSRAEAALELLTSETTFPAIRRHWSDFLVAANGVYTKLEQGTKDKGRLTAWFGRKKHERKTDKLMQYLHQARNDDEHGLNVITNEAESIEVSYKMGPHPNQIITLEGRYENPDNPPRNFKLTNLDTGTQYPVHSEKFKKYIRAGTVHNLGVAYPLPKSHAGEEIDVDEPAGLARIGLEFLRDLIKEAKALSVTM